MAAPIQLTYLLHSGFAVRTHQTLLVFDDAQPPASENDSLSNGHITQALIDAHAQTYFFVSHAHGDHFNPDIYRFASSASVQYILGYDIPQEYEGMRMRPGESRALAGLEVRAYDSTDEGVSFLVSLEGWTLFHAGDLNLWHWRGESTPKEIEQAETEYLRAVEPIIGQEIDFAFFPLDPRMGEMYDAGALHFLMHAKPRVMIPMHWWNRPDVPVDFARRNHSKRVEIVPMIEPGETLRAKKSPDGQILLSL